MKKKMLLCAIACLSYSLLSADAITSEKYISHRKNLKAYAKAYNCLFHRVDGSLHADSELATLNSLNAADLDEETMDAVRAIASPFLGNVLRVDTVFGSDISGARDGRPYATINGALSEAFSGDVVWIFPGTYTESFTIPSGVSVHGLDAQRVIISKDVTTATDLVTMGTSTRLENVTLSLTSSSHVQLRGIVFPGTTSATATVSNVTLNVNNAGAGAGTSNVYGIHSNGTGLPAQDFCALCASVINVYSTGSGAKRGILVDSANYFNLRDSNIVATNNGTASAIGIETNSASAILSARTSTIGGFNTSPTSPTAFADISQTAGILSIISTDLLHANANGLGFDTSSSPTLIIWAASGNLPTGKNFMQVGTGSPSGTPMEVRCDQQLIVRSLSVQATSGPGGTDIDSWTLFKNDVATGMIVSLTGIETSNMNNTKTVSFSSGDRISLQMNKTNGSGLKQPVVVMSLY